MLRQYALGYDLSSKSVALWTMAELKTKVLRYVEELRRGQVKLDPRLLEWASSNDNIMRLGYRVLGDSLLSQSEYERRTSEGSLSVQKSIEPARLTLLLQRAQDYIGLCSDLPTRQHEIERWADELQADYELLCRIFAACNYDLPDAVTIIVLLAPVKGNDGYATVTDASRAMLRKAVEFGRRRSSQLGNHGSLQEERDVIEPGAINGDIGHKASLTHDVMANILCEAVHGHRQFTVRACPCTHTPISNQNELVRRHDATYACCV
jgi:hypothetical protein